MSIYETGLYFFIYAILGWCAEVAFAAVKERKFVNRGFLNGPLCPIYGAGVVTVAVLLEPFHDRLLLLYLASAVLTTVMEGLTGWALDRLFHHKWWDYTGMPLNIGGYVCLPFSLVWGAACVAIVKVIHPAVEDLVAFLPKLPGMILLLLMCCGLGADLAVTVNGILKWNRQLDALDKIAADLRKLSGYMGENIYENVMDFRVARETGCCGRRAKRSGGRAFPSGAGAILQAEELKARYRALAERDAAGWQTSGAGIPGDTVQASQRASGADKGKNPSGAIDKGMRQTGTAILLDELSCAGLFECVKISSKTKKKRRLSKWE